MPPLAFASELALKVAVPSTAVSWTVTHVVSNELPYVWTSRMNAEVTSASICAWVGFVAAGERHRVAVLALDLEDLELAAGVEVVLVGTARSGRRSCWAAWRGSCGEADAGGAVLAADVLDDPDVAVVVLLDALEAAAAEEPEPVDDRGRVVGRGLPDAAGRWCRCPRS